MVRNAAVEFLHCMRIAPTPDTALNFVDSIGNEHTRFALSSWLRRTLV